MIDRALAWERVPWENPSLKRDTRVDKFLESLNFQVQMKSHRGNFAYKTFEKNHKLANNTQIFFKKQI